MKVCRPVISVPLLILLGGCVTVGPNFKQPGVAVPESFSSGGVSWSKAVIEKPVGTGEWWRAYKDATLNGLIGDALRQNQSLEASAGRLREAQALSRVARSRAFPAVDLNGGWDRSKSRPPVGSGGSAQIRSTTDLGLTFSYELDLWGKVRRQNESALAGEAAAALSYDAAALSLSGETATNYFALRSIDAERAILRSTMELRNEALQLLTRQRDAGAIGDLDVFRAETEMANARGDLIALEQNRGELLAAIALLTGRPATGFQIAAADEIPAPPNIPADQPSAVVQRRPDIASALMRVVAANADIGVAQAAFYPSITLGATGGYNSAGGALLSADNQVWSLGPSLRLPITGAGLLRAQRDAAIARQQTAAAQYRQTVLTAFQEVESALVGVAVLGRLEAARNQAADASNRTFNLSVDRYKAGLVSFLEVVDADRVRLEARRQASRTRGERLASSVALARALGGPWR
jgi:multidrug efflux system outer membrane protein